YCALLVPRRKHRPPAHAQCLVLGQGQRHGEAAHGRAALAREVPALVPGQDVLEATGRLVHVRIDLEQEVTLGKLLLLVTTGHGFTSRLPQTASSQRRTDSPTLATKNALRKSSAYGCTVRHARPTASRAGAVGWLKRRR